MYYIAIRIIGRDIILKDLMNIFSKVQFIVSTHAPEVINSAKSDSIVILKDNAVFTVYYWIEYLWKGKNHENSKSGCGNHTKR